MESVPQPFDDAPARFEMQDLTARSSSGAGYGLPMSAPTAPTHADAVSPPDGSSERWVRRLWTATALILLAALAVAVVSSWQLSSRYMPMSGTTDVFNDPEAAMRPSPSGWVQAHQISLAVAVLGSLLWAGFTVALVRSRSAGRIVAGVLAAVATVALTLLSMVTWSLVAWDQLALWSVTVGSNQRGLWRPAFSEEVRFLLIDGAEIGQSTYRASLLIHLATPILAALTLVAATAIVGRTPSPRSVGQS